MSIGKAIVKLGVSADFRLHFDAGIHLPNGSAAPESSPSRDLKSVREAQKNLEVLRQTGFKRLYWAAARGRRK